MRIDIGGTRLFVDFEGAGLVPDGPEMREKPALILLHGGPGADHSIYKPAFGAALGDICQIVHYDHRGSGRSDNGTPADWTLERWADDLAALCDVLGLDRPIVFGASFGGFVAQAYATRYPDRLSALILSNTAARVDFEAIYTAFDLIGGPVAGAAARAYWGNPTAQSRRAYAESCLPFYTRSTLDPDFLARIRIKDPVALHFNGPDNEMGRFDFRAALARVTCPALVISGALDPIMPAVFGDDIAAHLDPARADLHCLPDTGHMPQFDAPKAFFALLRDFVERTAPDA